MKLSKIVFIIPMLVLLFTGTAFAQLKVETHNSGETFWSSRYTTMEDGYKYTVIFKNTTATHDPKIQLNIYYKKDGEMNWPVYPSQLRVTLGLNDGSNTGTSTMFTPTDNIADDGVAAFETSFVRRARFALPEMKAAKIDLVITDKAGLQFPIKFTIPDEIVGEWKQVVNMNGR